MKHLTPFNELRGYVYRDAAAKLKKMGHISRADALNAHSYDMEIKAAEKYNIGQCTFEGGTTGDFISFDEYMTFDTYVDGKHGGHASYIYWPVFFKFDVANYDDNYIHNPFCIDYDVENDNITIDCQDLEGLERKFNVNLASDAWLFNNRKDANKVVRALLDIEFPEKMKENEHFSEFEENYKKMLVKLRVNQIWR